jgi:hypothetical protein
MNAPRTTRVEVRGQRNVEVVNSFFSVCVMCVRRGFAHAYPSSMRLTPGQWEPSALDLYYDFTRQQAFAVQKSQLRTVGESLTTYFPVFIYYGSCSYRPAFCAGISTKVCCQV